MSKLRLLHVLFVLLVKLCRHRFQLAALQPSQNTVPWCWGDFSSSARGRYRRTHAHECINSRKILSGEKPIKSDKLVFPCGCWRRNTQHEQLLFFLRLPTRTSRFLLAALQPPPAELCSLEVAPLQRLSASFLAISSVSVHISGSPSFSLPAFRETRPLVLSNSKAISCELKADDERRWCCFSPLSFDSFSWRRS